MRSVVLPSGTQGVVGRQSFCRIGNLRKNSRMSDRWVCVRLGSFVAWRDVLLSSSFSDTSFLEGWTEVMRMKPPNRKIEKVTTNANLHIFAAALSGSCMMADLDDFVGEDFDVILGRCWISSVDRNYRL